MRVDSDIFPTQASELSNVIGSSPVSSGTVQALGDDSAAVGSTSTSSPLQALRDDSATAGLISASSPVQALGDDSAAVGSTSTHSPLQALRDDSAAGLISTSSPVEALGDDSTAVGSTSTSSPLQVLGDDSAAVGSTSTSSPLQVLGDGDDSVAVSSTSTSSPLQVLRDDSASGFGTFAAAPTPSTFASMQDPVKASGPSQNLCKPASSPLFGRPDIGFSPSSSSSTTTVFGVLFGTTPGSVSSPFGPTQAGTSTFLPFGGVPASSLCNYVFGCPPASSSSNLFRPNPSTNASVSSPFGFYPSVTSVSSSPTQTLGPKAVFSVSTASPSIFASPSVPDHSQKTNFATTQGNFPVPGFGCGFSPAAVPSGGFGQPNAPSASHDWSRRTEQGSRFPGCAPTPGAVGFGQPNAPFTGGGTRFPSSFSSFSTSFPAVSSSVQRPHEAAALSSPPLPFGCTACGARSSSSASLNFTFNGATTPPSAATSLPVMFYPTSGFGTSSAAQGTTPAPVQGYILLPFAAMSLQ